MSIEFKAKLIKKDSSLMWKYRIEVPLEISEQLYPKGSKEAKRVVCKINHTETIQLALTPDGKGFYYIVLNKEVRKNLQIGIGDLVQITISKDKSKYGIALPIEMEELLEQDELRSRYFHQLTPGKQRTLLHLIAKPKSEAIRIKKAITILDYLTLVKGKLDFKELNMAFKKSNQ